MPEGLVGPWTRTELGWAAATSVVALVLWRFSDDSMGWVERLPLIAFAAATAVILALPWLRRRFGPRHDRVGFDEHGVVRHGAGGARESIRWQDLQRVVIVPASQPPDDEPAYWLLLDHSGRSGCAVPADADGIDALVSRLRTLPGYRATREAEALKRPGQSQVEVWRRSV